MTRAAIIILALVLAGCGGGYGTGLEAHNINWPDRIGKQQTVTIKVDWMMPADATKACSRFITGTDAMACAVWQTGKMNAAAKKFMAGADCRIFAPPNSDIMAHELLRCIGTNDYQVGIMGPVEETGVCKE